MKENMKPKGQYDIDLGMGALMILAWVSWTGGSVAMMFSGNPLAMSAGFDGVLIAIAAALWVMR